MKRTLIMITLILTLLLHSCGSIRFRGPLSCTYFSIENYQMNQISEVDLTDDAAKEIISILNCLEWDASVVFFDGFENYHNYRFVLKNATIIYEPQFSRLTNINNQRYAYIDLPTQAKLDELIGKTN